MIERLADRFWALARAPLAASQPPLVGASRAPRREEAEAPRVNHDECMVGNKPGVSGAWCFTHAVRIVRDGITWKTRPSRRSS